MNGMGMGGMGNGNMGGGGQNAFDPYAMAQFFKQVRRVQLELISAEPRCRWAGAISIQ